MKLIVGAPSTPASPSPSSGRCSPPRCEPWPSLPLRTKDEVVRVLRLAVDASVCDASSRSARFMSVIGRTPCRVVANLMLNNQYRHRFLRVVSSFDLGQSAHPDLV